MIKKTSDEIGSPPEWFLEELVKPYQAGISRMFILHGDINGLIANSAAEEGDEAYVSLRKYLEGVLDERPLVMFYNIASGLRFLKPEMEKIFRRAAELDSADAAPKDPIAAAKAGLQAKRSIPRDPESCLPLIEKALRNLEGAAAIIQSIHFIAPSSGGNVSLPPAERANIERLRNWSQSDTLRDNGNLVILVTDELAKVSSELKQSGGEIKSVFIPKPTTPERLEFLQVLTAGNDESRELQAEIKKLRRDLVKSKKGESRDEIKERIAECQESLANLNGVFTVPDDFDASAFALASQGMNLRQMLEIFLEAKASGQNIDINYTKKKKAEILNNQYGDLLELVNPRHGLEDIGGLGYIKDYFQTVLEAIRTGNDLLVPQGVTLMGPPGTGKTAIVESLAFEAGFNFVKMKNILSMWVGDSETRMERLVYALRSLAPVVVMNDEADLNNADRNAPKGDSGVSERIMKMWMELLSDPKIRGQIIVINCTNRPDRLDPALKRSGRSDERILVPMPSAQERPAIFQVMVNRHQVKCGIKDFSPFIDKTAGLSGADIEVVVLKAYRFAFMSGKDSIDTDVLDEAIADFIPSASQSEIDRMTLVSLTECSSHQLLPPDAKEILLGIIKRNLVEDLPELVAQIRARKIIDLS